MRNFKNILTMVVGSLSILFYTQIGSATTVGGTAAAAAALTDRAASITDGGDHSAEARIFLYCDQGVATTGVQNCQIYAQVLGGVKGVISDENDSAIALTAAGVIKATVYGTNNTTIQSATGVSATKGVTADLVALSGATNPKTDLTVNSIALRTDSGGADQQNNQASGLDGLSPTGDLCRLFDSAGKPDIYDIDGTYTAAGSDTIDTNLALSSSNAALFLLQGFMGDAFPRSTAGYAEAFTVPYTITVTSNTAGTASTACGN